MVKQQPEQAGFQTGVRAVHATQINTGCGARDQVRNGTWLDTRRYASVKTWFNKFESIIIPKIPIIQRRTINPGGVRKLLETCMR